MNDNTDIQNKLDNRVKFTNLEIRELFDLFNKDAVIRKLKGYASDLIPVSLASFKHLDTSRIDGKFNAYVCIDLGSAMDNYPNNVRPSSERKAEGIDKVSKLTERMQEVCSSSENPRYNVLKVKMVTKELKVCITKVDPHGMNDEYGMEVFYKICW